MCGVIHFDGRPVEPDDLNRMLNCIQFRGPDGRKAWLDGAVGLGHCMLLTTPESLHETLPRHAPEQHLVITADARIDNRAELFQKLGIHDTAQKAIPDSELILATYLRWGERCVDHLLGDFAFAIWEQHNRRLFCARDHFGVRPFFYHYDAAKQIFLFASDLKAILNYPGVPDELDDVRIVESLIPIWNTADTVYQSIMRLPPGSFLTVNSSHFHQSAYWSLTKPEELCLGSEEEYAEGFRYHFEEAICCRLRSAYPIAAHVSGGLDSSSVAAVAQRMLANRNEKLHTISMRFEQISECDESEYFRALTELPGVIPHYVYPENDGPLSVFQDHLDYIDEPTLPFNHHFTWLINRKLHQKGLRIALTGFDGDTIIGHGNGYLIELMRKNDWPTFWNEVTAIAARLDRSPQHYLAIYVYPYFERLAKDGRWRQFVCSAQALKQVAAVKPKFYLRYGIKPALPKRLLAWLDRQRNVTSRYESPQLTNPALARRTGLADHLRQHAREDDFSYTADSPQLRILKSGIIALMMESLTLNSSVYGIESRHPFMDLRLVNYSLSLPPKLQIGDGWSRHLFRRSMMGIVPDSILRRATKTNMSPAVFYGFWTVDSRIVQSAMFQTVPKAARYIECATVASLFQTLPDGRVDRDQEARLLWQALQFAIWYEQKIVRK